MTVDPKQALEVQRRLAQLLNECHAAGISNVDALTVIAVTSATMLSALSKEPNG
jgi:hypothetical protein